MITRVDGWQSALTGVGTARDKTTSVFYLADIICYEDAQELWRGDDMAARVVEVWPDEMLRRGFSVTTADDKEGEAALAAHFEQIDLQGALYKALCYQRAYGGGAILLGALDGNPDLSKPLDVTKVKSLDWLSVFDAREVQPSKWYDNPAAPKYGTPSHYRLAATLGPSGTTATTGTDIHESRFLVFDGFRATSNARLATSTGWGDSVLNRVWTVLKGFNLSWASAWHLVSDFSQGIYKFKGLAELLRQDNGAALRQRLATIDMAKSVMRSIVVDADSEDYSRLTTPMSGLSDVLDRANVRLSAAADMPLTLLMGESPGGLGSNGSSEMRSFYGRVEAKQTRVLTPAIMRVVDILAAVYKIAPGYKVKYPALWTPTDLETAQARNLQMLTDTGYINAGVLYPEEVAQARFGSSDYSYETPVDFEARETHETLAPTTTQPPPLDPGEVDANNVEVATTGQSNNQGE